MWYRWRLKGAKERGLGKNEDSDALDIFQCGG